MECDEKEFGCLCKNVGGHFPCLFHGLNVNDWEKKYQRVNYLRLHENLNGKILYVGRTHSFFIEFCNAVNLNMFLLVGLISQRKYYIQY